MAGPARRTEAPGSEDRPASTAASATVPLSRSIGNCCPGSKSGFPAIPAGRGTRVENAGQIIGYRKRIRPCSCRKRFCPDCGPWLGRQLQSRLLHRLESFTNVFGLTLTVDPGLFDTPEQAWLYVMGERLQWQLVQELDALGFLHSKAYFWVVEFQKDTECAHWHLLLDATRVPIGQVIEIWGRFRPPWAPELPEKVTAKNYKGRAPAFGSLRFTVRGNKRSAGFYAGKYLTKHPRDGFPNWVLDRVGRMPRYGHSHQFFPRTSGHDRICFCAVCRGDEKPQTATKVQKESNKGKKKKPRQTNATIRQRIAQCGQKSTILSVPEVELPDGVIVEGRASFVENIDLPFKEVREVLDVDENCSQIYLRSGDESLLFQRMEEKA